MTDPARIHGSVPALVTPFTPAHAIDEAAVGRLVEHVIAGGAHGFNVLGTTGEFALVPPSSGASCCAPRRPPIADACR